MNRNEFNRFITGINIPGPGDLEGLKELTTLFPWFHSAHMLLLKGLKENADIRFDTQLKTSALLVTDREVLYHYVFFSPEAGITIPLSVLKEDVLPSSETNTAEEALPLSPVDEIPGQAHEEEKKELQDHGHEVEETVSPEEHEEKAEIFTEKAVVTEDYSGGDAESVDVMEHQPGATDEQVVAGETPQERPEETPGETPQEMPEETPQEMPEETLQTVPEETPGETPKEAGEETLQETPEETPQEMPEETLQTVPEETPGETPKEAGEEMLQETPEETPQAMPEETRQETLEETEEKTLEAIQEGESREIAPEQAPEKISEEVNDVSAGEIAGETTVMEQEVRSVDMPEQTAQKSPETVTGADTSLRTREDLIAEIEARLRELESEAQPEEEMQYEPHSEPEEGMQYDPQPESEEEIQHEPETGTEPVPVTGELLELLPDEPADEENQVSQLTPNDLIDRFIRVSPTIGRMTAGEYQPAKDLAEDSTDEQGSFITETLANIYINQGYYTKAINIYEKLSLQFPEKSTYFASRIEKIRDLIK